MIELKHGKPLVFGKEHNRGIRMRNAICTWRSLNWEMASAKRI